MIVVLGDIHFRDDAPYFSLAGKRFVDWIKTQSWNTPEDSVILLGDITDRVLNSGEVVGMIVNLVESIRGKVYILQGNHDFRIHLNEFMGQQSSLSFLPHTYPEDRVRVVVSPEIIEIEGLNFLFLPYLLPFFRAKEKYENPPSEWLDADVLVGHFADSSLNFPSHQVVDISPYVSKMKVILGHIHVPASDYYPGSVFPQNITEVGPRYYLTYSSGVWSKHPLPEFLTFEDVVYPQPIEPKDSLVALTVFSCSAEGAAKDLYQTETVFVRKVYPQADRTQVRRKTVMTTEEFEKMVKRGTSLQDAAMKFFEKFTYPERVKMTVLQYLKCS